MKVVLFITALLVIAATPVLAMFTEDFGTNPFGKTGFWGHSGDTGWVSNGNGNTQSMNVKTSSNDFVTLGQSTKDTDNLIWRSFTVQTTGKYGVGFDYRFIGTDTNPKLDDTFCVQIGTGKDSLYNVFGATSSTGLTNFSGWQNTQSNAVVLEAGKQYWLRFELKEASGRLAPITYLNLDNVSLNETCVVTSVVPAPGAVLLGGIGVGLGGWRRTRRNL